MTDIELQAASALLAAKTLSCAAENAIQAFRQEYPVCYPVSVELENAIEAELKKRGAI